MARRGAAGILKTAEAASFGHPLKERCQVSEFQTAPEILLEFFLSNTGATEFKSQFDIVPSDLPGEAIHKLIVGIDAIARIAGGRTGLGEEAARSGWRDGNQRDGQAGVVRAAPLAIGG